MKYSNVLVLSLAMISTFSMAKLRLAATIEDIENETSFRFVNECIKAGWTGIMTGWYHSSNSKFIPTKDCFGNWIEEDLTEIKAVALQVKELDFINMQFEDVSNAAVDCVELFFKQDEQCGFRKVITDFGDFCEASPTCKPDAVFTNLQKNAFQIVTKLTMMAELIQKAKTINSTSQVYDAVFEFGEVIGGIAASLISFKV